jgi:hypothetical protein
MGETFVSSPAGAKRWIELGLADTPSRRSDLRLSNPKRMLARSKATSVQRWMSSELRPGSSIGSPSTRCA